MNQGNSNNHHVGRYEVGQDGPTFMVIAGEASGDDHAAGVVRNILRLCPNAKVFGMGGSKLRAAGMETVIDSEKHASVMGATEILGAIPGLVRAARYLVAEAAKRKPVVGIVLDFPDFNMRVAKKLDRLGVKMLYFIPPQIWAWRRGRIKHIQKHFKKIANIFPFEEQYYQSRGVDAEYVGHPFLARPPMSESKAEFCNRVGLDAERPILALLPGSRRAEVSKLLHIMGLAGLRIQQARPAVQIAIPVAANIDRDWLKSFLPTGIEVVLLNEQASELLHVADAAVCASGTVTVEATLAKVPMVVVYRLSPLSYRIGRIVIRGVKNFAMPNLLAGHVVVTELLQDEVTPERVGEEVERIFGDAQYRAKMIAELEAIEQKLSRSGTITHNPSERVAELALELAGVEIATNAAQSEKKLAVA